MQITITAKEQIRHILHKYPNSHFSITTIGNSLSGFNWEFKIQRELLNNSLSLDAQIELCNNPRITTIQSSYPALLNASLDFNESQNEFVITIQ